MDEAKEVFDVVFPSGDQAAVVVHPGEEPLDFPASAVSSKRAFVLRYLLAVGAMGSNHLHSAGAHLLIQFIGIVGLVSDQSGGQLVEEAFDQNSFHKPAFGRRSVFDRYGERKTVTRGDSDDLGALAAPGWTNGKAPFLALAKVASTNASSKFSLPRSCKCRASRRSAATSLPSRTHC